MLSPTRLYCPNAYNVDLKKDTPLETGCDSGLVACALFTPWYGRLLQRR